MAPKLVNIFGPPGSGKTSVLTSLFIKAAHQLKGPEKIAAVTYTRSAAAELQFRVAKQLGLTGTPEALRRQMPWVGTIHSLCYRLLGQPKMVDRKALAAFALDNQIPVSAEALRGIGLSPEDLDGFVLGDERDLDGAVEELLQMRRLYATARHRGIAFRDALETLPAEQLARMHPDRLVKLADKYTDWKRLHKLMDYEDLLAGGKLRTIPCPVILADECQDQTQLLWEVLDRWAEHAATLVCAGDPWQALFTYSGAIPLVFRTRPGAWKTLDISHRLNARSVRYATALLHDAGWRDPMISAWTGVGGEPRDGTRLVLARTHHLLNPLRRDLIDAGAPFAQIGGVAPLATRAADAFRALTRVQNGGSAAAHAVAAAGEQLANGAGGPARSGLKSLGAGDPHRPVDAADVRIATGHTPDELRRLLKWEDYFRRVERKAGLRALFEPPTTSVSTIHAAKGREADHVTLLRTWGWTPGRALSEDKPSLDEACVAYVASTRHRVSLSIVDGGEGIPYPFP